MNTSVARSLDADAESPLVSHAVVPTENKNFFEALDVFDKDVGSQALFIEIRVACTGLLIFFVLASVAKSCL